MTDIHCSKKKCLNNCKDWCKANAICIDGSCKSYVSSHSVMRGKHARVHKSGGKYKPNRDCIK